MSRDEWICDWKPSLLLVSTLLVFGVGWVAMMWDMMTLSMPYGPYDDSVTVSDADPRTFLMLGIIVAAAAVALLGGAYNKAADAASVRRAALNAESQSS